MKRNRLHLMMVLGSAIQLITVPLVIWPSNSPSYKMILAACGMAAIIKGIAARHPSLEIYKHTLHTFGALAGFGVSLIALLYC